MIQGSSQTTDNPIIIIWAVPRSRSTVFERVWMQVPNMSVFHELFEPIDDATPRPYGEIRDQLVNAAQYAPVILKDTFLYCLDENLKLDSSFLKQVKHIFLIRDPKETIPSFLAIEPDPNITEFSFEAAYHLHQHLISIGCETLVIDTSDLISSQHFIFETAFKFAGLPFKDSYLTFNAADDLSSWEKFSKWHQDALAHTQIINTSERHNELINRESSKIQSILKHHLPFYKSLLTYALKDPVMQKQPTLTWTDQHPKNTRVMFEISPSADESIKTQLKL
ncbi:MAG: hypothetical protein U1E78_06020 [Gammaproteobacteria bacterium]